MSKVDWSLAPEGATHANTKSIDAGFMFYKVNKDIICRFNDSNEWVKSVFDTPVIHWVERKKLHKPWSGPEDGFPPVNSVCEFVSSDTSWGKVKIIAHDEGKVVFKPSGDSYYGVTPDHKAVFRPLIDTEQKRETAIRELMDIAQVDCRVTAARLVDAGFKREGV